MEYITDIFLIERQLFLKATQLLFFNALSKINAQCAIPLNTFPKDLSRSEL